MKSYPPKTNNIIEITQEQFDQLKEDLDKKPSSTTLDIEVWKKAIGCCEKKERGIWTLYD